MDNSSAQQPETIEKVTINWLSAIQKGAVIGVVGFVIMLIAYFVSFELLVAWWFGILILLLTVALIIIFGRQERNNLYGGYLEFFDAWKVLMAMAIGSLLVSVPCQYLLYNVIDPELGSKMAEAAVEQASKWMGDAATDEVLDQMRENMADQFNFSIGTLLINTAKALPFYAIGNLLLALFVRRKRELF